MIARTVFLSFSCVRSSNHFFLFEFVPPGQHSFYSWIPDSFFYFLFPLALLFYFLLTSQQLETWNEKERSADQEWNVGNPCAHPRCSVLFICWQLRWLFMSPTDRRLCTEKMSRQGFEFLLWTVRWWHREAIGLWPAIITLTITGTPFHFQFLQEIIDEPLKRKKVWRLVDLLKEIKKWKGKRSMNRPNRRKRDSLGASKEIMKEK